MNLIVKDYKCQFTEFKNKCDSVGSFIQFKCLRGYQLVNSKSFIKYTNLINVNNCNFFKKGNLLVSCQKSNKWTEFPKCIINKSLPVCTGNFPIPKNGNKNNEQDFIISNKMSKKEYQIGEQVSFSCQLGYFIFKSTFKSTCLSDGTWSKISNCIKPDCWDKVPARPLNGRRDVELKLNKINGSTSGTHCNFTCNPFYKLRGKKTLRCLDGVWELDGPLCYLPENYCKIKPSERIGMAKLISMSSITIKNEITLGDRFESVRLYLKASYTCPVNTRFNVNDDKLIFYKRIKNKTVSYVNMTCFNKDEWNWFPKCILK